MGYSHQPTEKQKQNKEKKGVRIYTNTITKKIKNHKKNNKKKINVKQETNENKRMKKHTGQQYHTTSTVSQLIQTPSLR